MANWILQLVSRLPHVSGMAEDTVENVFNVGTDTEPDGALALAASALVAAFYTVTPTGAVQDLGFYISESISRTTNACSILTYKTDDLTGATPFGSPMGTLSFTMTPAAAGTPLPEEVSSVISYHADLTDVPVTMPNPSPPPAIIRPAQRRRGRVFVGPLTGITAVETANRVRPSDQFMDDSTYAFRDLATGIDGLSGVAKLGIWSKADGEHYPVTDCYMDNAWDTQRRRGPDPTSRVEKSIP